MRVLVDASFPASVDHVPNSAGVEIDRVHGEETDQDLIIRAADEGYAAVVVMGSEMVARSSLPDLAAEKGVVLVCSVTEDPFDAESNLRQSLSTLQEHILNAEGAVVWLRKDGLRT